MKAVILSGGFGTRMRPLTYTTPKPLLPILNKPLIRHIIDQLPEDIDEVVLAANYKIDMLREYFEYEDIGKEIHVVDEPKPLGTGGAVKNVEEYLDDTFFVINSDIISSIDLKNYLDFYRSKEAVGAISAWEVDNPEEFGIFELDDNDRILRFQEKPEPWEAFSNTINAGHYILEPEVLDLIPPDEKVSMEDEIFPLLVDDGLFGFGFDGYWVDCGRPSSFFEATRVLLDEKGQEYLIGDRSFIEGEIEEYSVVGIDCTIGNSKISNSILLDGVEIDDDCVIENSIIGYDVIIEDDVKIVDSVIADNEYLDKGTEIVNKKIRSEGEE
ncbi:MAG: sugar phosphate nucleotidyltransferase [Candidatus Saliniplasma sp.]